MSSISAIFFDLDGTLVDSSIGIHNGFTYTFEQLGVTSPDAKTIRGFMGPPLETSFATCLPTEQIEQAIQLYRSYYKEKGVYEAQLYPHIKDLLVELAKQFPLYITTTKNTPTAIDMAMNKTVDGAKVYDLKYFSVALITLLITIICAVALRGFAKQIPVLLGIVFGYIVAVIAGLVNFQPVIDAPWFSLPKFTVPFVTYTPEWNIAALAMVPIAIVTINEHIGHQMVLSEVIGRNVLKDPGLHRSILADGTAMMFASLLGGPPSTTYGENIGVLAITRVFSVFVLGGAAVFALILSFVGKFSALISTIPSPVMGGVSILLFGIIASSGLRMLVDEKVDLSINRNLVISSVIIVLGVGGAMLKFESIHFELPAMALAAISGVLLNAFLPKKEK